MAFSSDEVASPSGPAGGGLSGTFPNPDVVLSATQVGFGSGSNTLSGSPELVYLTATGVLDINKSMSGGIMSLNLRNLSNTAASSARILAEVAGTSAGDPMSQWSVAGTRQFTLGIDTSVAGQPLVLSVGTVLGTTDVYSINASGEVNIGTGIPVTGEKFHVRTAGDTDVGFETTTTSQKATVKVIAGANSARLVQQGSTAAGTTNGVANANLTSVQTTVGSIMLTAPDSTSTILFCVNGAVKATVNNQRLLLTNRLNQAKGADVASAGTLTLGIDGDSFDITGTTNIDFITTTNWTAGARVLLQFDGVLTVNNNTGSVPGSTAAILLVGGVAFVTTAGDTLGLWFDGGVWRETGRTVI